MEENTNKSAYFGNEICQGSEVPAHISWSTMSISILLSIITVPGNLLIVFAIIKNPHRNLRTPFNVFVINLIMADLIVGLITEPAFVVFHFIEAKRGKLLRNEIIIVHLTYFCSLTASLMSITALAVDRCQAVTCNYVRSGKLTNNIYASMAIWLVSLTLPWSIIVTGFYLFAFMYVNTAILVSLIIIVISFCRVKRNLQGKVTEWNSMGENMAKARALKREHILTNSFMLMLTSFAICLTPSFVMAYIINFCVTCHCDVINWLRDFHFLFPLFNSAANQFLYPWRMRNFRSAVGAIFRCDVTQWKSSEQFEMVKEASEIISNYNKSIEKLPGCGNDQPILLGIIRTDVD